MIAASVSANAASALIVIFAVLAALVVVLFLGAMALSWQHRRRRARGAYARDLERAITGIRGVTPAGGRPELGRAAVLTIGDLVADPDLRRTAARKPASSTPERAFPTLG
jgi:hypothetical protein